MAHANIPEGAVVEIRSLDRPGVFWSEVKSSSGGSWDLWAPWTGAWRESLRVGAKVALCVVLPEGKVLRTAGEVGGVAAGTRPVVSVAVGETAQPVPQRRRELRVPAGFEARKGRPGRATPGDAGWVEELSPSGCTVWAVKDWLGADGFTLSLELPDEDVRVPGFVLNREPLPEEPDRVRYTVCFEGLTDEADAAIARYVYDYQRRHGIQLSNGGW
jgi:hypothetical protein